MEIVIKNAPATFAGATVSASITARYTTDHAILVEADLRGVGRYKGASARREVVQLPAGDATVSALAIMLATYTARDIAHMCNVKFDKLQDEQIFVNQISALAALDVAPGTPCWAIADELAAIF